MTKYFDIEVPSNRIYIISLLREKLPLSFNGLLIEFKSKYKFYANKFNFRKYKKHVLTDQHDKII